MKILTLLLLLAICLPHIASSTPEIVLTGPFNVSFDIDTTKKLIYQPQSSDTRKGPKGEAIAFYGVEIRDANAANDAAKVQIGINEYDSPISYSLEYKADQTAKLFKLIDGTVSLDYRTIDNSPGYIVTGVNDAGRIEYSSCYRIGKQIEVTIIGALPEIGNVFDTIHIEKRSKPASNETM